MKTTLAPSNCRATSPRSSMYLAQARAREQSWLDFRLELELIGAYLRRLRREKGYGIDTVAKALKMPKYRLCKIEHGMYLHFDVRDLHRLSDLYNTTPLEILSVIPDGSFDDLAY